MGRDTENTPPNVIARGVDQVYDRSAMGWGYA